METLASDFNDFKYFITNQVQQLEKSHVSQNKTGYEHQNILPQDTRRIIKPNSEIVVHMKEDLKFLREENLELRNCIIQNQQSVSSDLNSHNSSFLIKILEKQLDQKQKIIETLLQQKMSSLNNKTISMLSHGSHDTNDSKERNLNNITTKQNISKLNSKTTNILPHESNNKSDVDDRDIDCKNLGNSTLHCSDNFQVEEK